MENIQKVKFLQEEKSRMEHVLEINRKNVEDLISKIEIVEELIQDVKGRN